MSMKVIWLIDNTNKISYAYYLKKNETSHTHIICEHIVGIIGCGYTVDF